MILIEKHHIKSSDSNWVHCDFLSYVNKNLYNSSVYYIKQHFNKHLQFKKQSIGLSSAVGNDFKNYLNQNPYVINKRHYLDNIMKDNNHNINRKIVNEYSFEFVHLNQHFIDSPEYNTKTHTDYISIQQNYLDKLQEQINYYNNLTKQQYWLIRSKSGKFNAKKSKKLKNKNFHGWKNKNINELTKQLTIPININTKILKQTQRQVNQDFSNYFSSLKAYYQDNSKFKALPQAPRYKQTGSKGRTVVTVPKEAISYVGYKKIVSHEKVIARANNHHEKYLKDSNLGVSKIRNRDKYFISIANMNIILETAIAKEQVKEIKIVPLNNPKINGYNVFVIYDNSINNNDSNNLPKNTNKNNDLQKDNSENNSNINEESIHNKVIKLINDIQKLNITKNKDNKQQNKLIKKQKELTDIIKMHKIDIASIDPGTNNLMTLATTNPDIQPIIINGRAVKSINQFYNKVISKEKSRLSELGLFTSNKIKRVTNKRNQSIENTLHVASRKVVDWLLENNMKYLVIGKNIGWKQDINIGKMNNQNFVQIPHAKLIEKLQYKCKEHNILVILQEEAYTSKASFLDLDNIPTYSKANSKEIRYSGRRIYRGLYKANNGKLMNADLNGALNILRKVIGNELFINNSNLIEDWAVNPIKINIQ